MCSIPKRSGSRNTLRENLLYLSFNRKGADDGVGHRVGRGTADTRLQIDCISIFFPTIFVFRN